MILFGTRAERGVVARLQLGKLRVDVARERAPVFHFFQALHARAAAPTRPVPAACAARAAPGPARRPR